VTPFADHVLNVVLKEIQPSDDLLNLLYALLAREEKGGYPALFQKPKAITHEHIDVYAHVIIEILKGLPHSVPANEGLSIPIYALRGWTPEDLVEQVHIPVSFRTWEFERKKMRDLYPGPQGGPFSLNSYSPLWHDLLYFNVGIRIPHRIRKLHTHVIGAPGAGKTQLLQQQISYDLETNASVIVIDSQRDLINTLMKSKLIPPERLVLVDPVDSVTHPLALNMFDTSAYDSTSDPIAFERQINSVVEQLNFVFSSIFDSELTDKQNLLFNFCIRLLLTIPRATIFTFVDLLDNGIDEYKEYVNQLPDLARKFFFNDFSRTDRSAAGYTNTRKEVSRRLYSLLETPSISRIFKSPENKLNIGREMDKGKVILISTDRSLLKNMGCSFFGRYFLALISQAMQDRANRRPEHRRKAYVYVDECGDYLQSADTNITDILEKGRKYNVGITLAHQHLGQLPPEAFQSVRSNTATKIAGSLSASDSRVMASEMRVDNISRKKLVFTASVADYLDGFEITVKPGIVENSETRTEEEMETVIQENRAKYCVEGEIEVDVPRKSEKKPKRDEPKGVPEDPLAPYT
jgi:predicted ATPase